MYAKHKQFFGIDSDDTLGGSWSHARVQQDARRQRHRRPAASRSDAARSEWDAEFRADIATFLDDELIEAAIDRSRPLELPSGQRRHLQGFR